MFFNFSAVECDEKTFTRMALSAINNEEHQSETDRNNNAQKIPLVHWSSDLTVSSFFYVSTNLTMEKLAKRYCSLFIFAL